MKVAVFDGFSLLMFPAVKNRVLGDRGLGRREAEAGQGGGGEPAKTGMRRAGAGRLGRAGLGCSTTKKGMKVTVFSMVFSY